MGINVDTDIGTIVIVIGVHMPYKTYHIQSSRETGLPFEFDEFDIFSRIPRARDLSTECHRHYMHKPFRTILNLHLS